MKTVFRIIVVGSVLMVSQAFAQGNPPKPAEKPVPTKPAVAEPAKGQVKMDEWPCFRGPTHDALSSMKGINKDWNRIPPKELWKVPMTDDGFAGPAVADGMLFIVNNKDKTDIVLGLDPATGKEIWRFTYPESGQWPFGYTVATPLVAGGKVYIWSRSGGAYCFNAKTGEKIWDRNLVAEYPAAVKLPDLKLAPSPLLDGQNVIFMPGGKDACVVAVDKDTGKTVWKSVNSKVSYASPIIASPNGVRQLIVYVADGVFGLDPKDGKQLWTIPWPTQYDDKKVPTPVVVGNRIFIASTQGGDTGLVDVKDNKPTVVWKQKAMQDHVATCLYYHDRLVGPTDTPVNCLMCLDAKDGKVLWTQQSLSNAGPIGIDDTIIAKDVNTGTLVMIDATVPEYKELGRFAGIEGGEGSWPAPIVANGHLFVRSKTALACFDLK